jgi:hypothetical protein
MADIYKFEEIRKFTDNATDYANSVVNHDGLFSYKFVGKRVESDFAELYGEVRFCEGCGRGLRDSDTYLAIIFDGQEIDSFSLGRGIDKDLAYWSVVEAMDQKLNPA